MNAKNQINARNENGTIIMWWCNGWLVSGNNGVVASLPTALLIMRNTTGVATISEQLGLTREEPLMS